MKKGKLFSKVLFALLFLSIVGFSLGFTSFFKDFEGSTHGGCHGTNPVSVTGSIDLNSSTGVTALPGEIFTISVQVISFTEGANKNVSIGFAQGNPGRGDNDKFSFSPIQLHGIDLDGSGNSGVLNFQTTAPSTFGNFSLIVDALEGGEGAGAYPFEWVTGSLNILVGFTSVIGAPI